MSATKTPDAALPSSAPIYTKTFVPGVGEVVEQQWKGERSDCESQYNGLVLKSKIGGIPGNNIRQVTLQSSEGRTTVMARFAREQSVAAEGLPADVVVVEELAAITIVRDVYAAPYFNTGGTASVTDDEAVVVRKASELKLKESEIDEDTAGTAWADWTAAMKELRHHVLHGQSAYNETAFTLRRSINGLITSQIKASFTDINTVVTAPVFKSDMDKLIESLPAGEWLKLPPQAEYLGEGKWRIVEEWQWAEKWSVMYGGTWSLT